MALTGITKESKDGKYLVIKLANKRHEIVFSKKILSSKAFDFSFWMRNLLIEPYACLYASAHIARADYYKNGDIC